MLTNRKTDWKAFQEDLNKNLQLNIPLKTTEQLECEAELFIANIQRAAWANTPTIKRKTVGKNYPVEIRILVPEKRKARRKWQQTRDSRDKNKLNKLTQQLKREIIEIKNELINSYPRELTDDKETNYSLWKVTKGQKRPKIQIPSIKMSNGM